LLLEVASRWRSQLRESEVIARLGGDEFVLVIEGIAPGQAASQLAPAAERLQHALAAPIDVGQDASVSIGMTMGAACYPADGDDPVVLLQQADAAMYELKQHKDTRVHWWKLHDAQDRAPEVATARVLAL
jgi:diguanylate cyclase (GGDEF)-like protein